MNAYVLKNNAIVYWNIDTSKTSSEEIYFFHSRLSTLHKVRAAQFQKEKDRSLFIVAHYALDTLLTNVFHIQPQISIDLHQKPFIANHPIHFNLSHTEKRILIGFSHAPIGVDVEKVIPLPDLDILVRNTMHPDEMRTFNSGDPALKLSLFYNLWTKKEAVVKALGVGLGKEFNTFSLETIVNDLQLHIHELAIAPQYSAAIATGIANAQMLGYKIQLTSAWIKSPLYFESS